LPLIIKIEEKIPNGQLTTLNFIGAKAHIRSETYSIVIRCQGHFGVTNSQMENK